MTPVSRRLEAGPYRMHAVVAGEGRPGPAIVLVHGLGVSSRYMLPLLRELSTAYEVHAIDLPGFGRSLDPPRHPDLRQLADAVGRWVEAAGLQAPVLLGNSLGCQHVVEAAAAGCETSGLVLVGPTVDRAARSWPGQVDRFIHNIPREPLTSLLPAVVPAYLRSGPVRMLRLFREALGDHLEQRLPSVSTPVLLVRGAEDPVSSRPWCESLAGRAPRGRSVEIASAAHAVHFSHPAAVAAAVTTLVDEWAGPAPSTGVG